MGGYGNSGGGPTRPKGHVYVPMPEAKNVYPRVAMGTGTTSLRDKLIREYGEVSVMHAEVSACVHIMIEMGIIHRDQFVDLVQAALSAADLRRQRHAESGGREA